MNAVWQWAKGPSSKPYIIFPSAQDRNYGTMLMDSIRNCTKNKKQIRPPLLVLSDTPLHQTKTATVVLSSELLNRLLTSNLNYVIIYFPHVIANLYAFCRTHTHKNIFWRAFWTIKPILSTSWRLNKRHFSKYHILCFTEEKSYHVGVNYPFKDTKEDLAKCDMKLYHNHLFECLKVTVCFLSTPSLPLSCGEQRLPLWKT